VNCKDSVRKGVVKSFDDKTIHLAEQAGFRLVERKNVEAPPSRFRLVQEKRNPDMPHIRHETFLCFRKE